MYKRLRPRRGRNSVAYASLYGGSVREMIVRRHDARSEDSLT